MYSSSQKNPQITTLLLTKILFFLLSFNNFLTYKPSLEAAAAAENQPSRILKSHSLLFSSNQQQQAITTTIQPPPPPPLPPVEVPDFVEPIGNHTVAIGRDAQLACKINKLGSFRTAWLRVEDKGILTIHNNVITRNYRIVLNNDDDPNNFILTIKNVQPSDKGGYMCQINSVPMRYAIGYLDVLTPPVFDNNNNNNNNDDNNNNGNNHGDSSSSSAAITVVSEGSNASLRCQANGNPVPEIVWRREDNEPIRLSNQEEVPKVEGNTLVLAQVSRLNSGAYLCIASNGVQPSASKRQVLDVHYKPVIRLPQTEVETKLGQSEAKLTCYVNLNPLGTYHWAKLDPIDVSSSSSSSSSSAAGGRARAASSNQEDDDQALIEHYELINSDKHEIVMKQVNSETIQMVLTVRRIEKFDLARYKCLARNSLGTQSNSIRLSESSTFSLNRMFGGRATGSDSASDSASSSSSSSSQLPADQQLNDQQQEHTSSAGGGEGGRQLQQQQQQRPGSQFLSTRANSRSPWIQRSSSSPSRVLSSESSSAASSNGIALMSISIILFVSLLSLINNLNHPIY